jgi:hypothetical protein
MPLTPAGVVYVVVEIVVEDPATVNSECSRCSNLKGQSHEIFDPQFFHQSISLRPLVNALKYFCIWFRFRGDIREYVSTPRYAA